MGEIFNLIFKFKWIFGLAVFAAISGCEEFDPIEGAPSFLRIDDFTFTTKSNQGQAAHRIEDVWVSIGSEFIGVFPIPSTIPILESGTKTITIAPGIRINGISAARLHYPFYTTDEVSVDLIQDSVVTVVPEFEYTDDADFAWVEDFEDVGVQLITTPSSEAEIQFEEDPSIALNGKSVKLALQNAQLKFECKSHVPLDLPGYGNTVVLEFNYKSNNRLVVGSIITNPGIIIQEPVLSLNPSETWKRVYVNLTAQVSGNPNNIGIEPFFGFIHDETVEGDAVVYLDNIKLVY